MRGLEQCVAWWISVLCLSCLVGCGPAETPSGQGGVVELRKSGPRSKDSRLLANWLLGELLEPGGTPDGALEARTRLDEVRGTGLRESVARGLDDAVHGRFESAPTHWMQALHEARNSKADDATLLARFALEQALSTSIDDSALWARHDKWLKESLRSPRRLGWRTRDAMAHWWLREQIHQANDAVYDQAEQVLGCRNQVSLVGPFGNGARSDRVKSFEAEYANPWPEWFDADFFSGVRPSRLDTQHELCTVSAVGSVREGVFYAESNFTTGARERAIVIVANALSVWLDGVRITDRDLREWGSWTKVGAGVVLEPGDHRIVAKLPSPTTSIRILRPDGVPLPLSTPKAAVPSLSARPLEQWQPNALRHYVRPNGVRAPSSPLLSYVLASLAQTDGEPEAGSMLLEPLVKQPEKATGTSLALAAELVERDAIFDQTQSQDLVRELHQQAVARDPGLWLSSLAVINQMVATKGVAESVGALAELARRFEQVPALSGALAATYGKLGWEPEYERTVLERAERFGEETDALIAAAEIHARRGETDVAMQLRQRVTRLDPDSDLLVTLATDKEDYPTALRELEQLRRRRPDSPDIKQRIKDVQRASGAPVDVLSDLQTAVEVNPTRGALWRELYDLHVAAGRMDDAQQVMVNSALAGADRGQVDAARDLIEGVTDLEAYRLDGRQIIAEYEAAEEHLSGTAARVLDYMAVVVKADGSSRMLEHEILRVQSEEAISRFSEYEPRSPLLLNVRVIKKDGQILEPEPVSGKPTVTLPHLEIGDYIETEQIMIQPATGGLVYDGPQWFFREKDVAYARSEFVFVAPAEKPLEVEVIGDVPDPTVTESGYFQVRRWRVDGSHAAPDEPNSVPLSEYLPSVKVSWGLTLERRLKALANRVEQTVPIDPRIVRIAEKIVQEIPAEQERERARRLYGWVLDNVQQGEQEDGRRAIIGKRGNRWQALVVLCRSLGVSVSWAVARNRLAEPPKGPAHASRQFSESVLRIGKAEPTWLVVSEVPFGYLPAAVRGEPAYLLGLDSNERIVLPADGVDDSISFTASGDLRFDGSSQLELVQTFSGSFAASLRQGMKELAERRLHDVLETRVLGIPGARLVKYAVDNLNRVDEPLSIHMTVEVSQFARPELGELRLDVPFALNLSALTRLPERKTTLLITGARRRLVKLDLRLAKGLTPRIAQPSSFQFKGFSVDVRDRVQGDRLILERHVTVPAGRIAPEEYAEFVQFVRAVNARMEAPILLSRSK